MLSLEDGFEDASSKPLDVVSVADGDAEECVQEILVEISKLKFGEILNRIFCQDIEAEEELNPPIRCAFGNVYFSLLWVVLKIPPSPRVIFSSQSKFIV